MVSVTVPAGISDIEVPTRAAAAAASAEIRTVVYQFGKAQQLPPGVTTGSDTTKTNFLLDADSGNQLITVGPNVEVVADTGGGNDTIVGGHNTRIIIGNNGDDVINANPYANLIITGTGNNTISVGGISETLYAGPGSNLVSVGGGVDKLALYGGNADIEGHAANLFLTGTNVTVGSASSIVALGKDTITLDQSATVTIGNASSNGGSFTGTGTFTTSRGHTDSVMAGSGAATMYGGAGSEYFAAGTGPATFVSGTGRETWVGGAASVFDIEATSTGGHMIIQNFMGSDSINIDSFGFSSADVTNHLHYGGGNTYFAADGIRVEFVGVHLTSSDFK